MEINPFFEAKFWLLVMAVPGVMGGIRGGGTERAVTLAAGEASPAAAGAGDGKGAT